VALSSKESVSDGECHCSRTVPTGSLQYVCSCGPPHAESLSVQERAVACAAGVRSLTRDGVRLCYREGGIQVKNTAIPSAPPIRLHTWNGNSYPSSRLGPPDLPKGRVLCGAAPRTQHPAPSTQHPAPSTPHPNRSRRLAKLATPLAPN
jgi:hypothetical protein